MYNLKKSGVVKIIHASEGPGERNVRVQKVYITLT